MNRDYNLDVRNYRPGEGRAAHIRDETWQSHQSQITAWHYLGLTAREILIKLDSRESRFHPNENQLGRRMRQWGLGSSTKHVIPGLDVNASTAGSDDLLASTPSQYLRDLDAEAQSQTTVERETVHAVAAETINDVVDVQMTDVIVDNIALYPDQGLAVTDTQNKATPAHEPLLIHEAASNAFLASTEERSKGVGAEHIEVLSGSSTAPGERILCELTLPLMPEFAEASTSLHQFNRIGAMSCDDSRSETRWSRSDKASNVSLYSEHSSWKFSGITGMASRPPTPSEIVLNSSSANERYQGRSSREAASILRVGRVFAVWSRQQPCDEDGRTVAVAMRTAKDEAPFAAVHRMVVVQEGRGFCFASPIIVYGKRCIKSPTPREEDSDAHTIIYMRGQRPRLLPGEPSMVKEPIKIIATGNENLSSGSRINFAELFTVQHTVEFMDIGRVAQSSMPYFKAYLNSHCPK